MSGFLARAQSGAAALPNVLQLKEAEGIKPTKAGVLGGLTREKLKRLV